MKPKLNRFLQGTLVLCFATALTTQSRGEGHFSSGVLTGDANSGVSTTKTYSALANVVGGNVVVNGVTFLGAAGTGTGWSTNNLAATPGNTFNATFGSGGVKALSGQAISGLFDGFNYNGVSGIITLSGLTAGQTYVTTMYCQDWSNGTTKDIRGNAFRGSEGGVAGFDEDLLTASMMHYTFVATGPTAKISVSPDGGAVLATFHLYGFSNEQVYNKSWTSGTDWTTSVWSPTGFPTGVGSNANLSAQGSATTLNLNASQTVGHVQLDGTNAWTLSSSNASVLTLQADSGGVSVLSTPSGSHTISTGIVLANDAMKTGPGTLTLSGSVSGSSGLLVTGGSLRLAQPLTYTGNTTIRSGTTLDLNDTVQTIASLNGGGTVVNNGSAAKIFSVAAGTFTGVITDHTTGTGTVALTKTGSGTFTISAPQTYTGNTVIADGTLRLDGSGTPLLADNFTATGNPNPNDLNYNGTGAVTGQMPLSARQTGSAAPAAWTANGNIQVGNGGTNVQQPSGTGADYLIAASTSGVLTGLPLTNTLVPGPIRISTDLFKGGPNADPTRWTSFMLTAGTTPGGPVVGSGELGFLYRQNTGVQIFNNGGAMDTITSTSDGQHFSFYLTDNAGTGSPFGGNGARVTVVEGSTVLGSYKLNTGFGTRYAGYSNTGGFVGAADNLVIAPIQSNVLPTANISLTSATAVLALDNVNQSVQTLTGVVGSTITISPFSSLTFPGSGNNTFAGNITGAQGNIVKSGSGTLFLTGDNSYGGVTTFQGGIINVASLTDFGTNGSLGNRTTEAANSGYVGLLFRGGTLQYTGSTPQSTNRGIRVSTTGGAFIDASGSNPDATLTFTSAGSADFFELAGSRQITFTGTNTGPNTFHMAITETGGQTSVNKTGPGTWILNGANTYTGDTTVTGGVLSVNGTSIPDNGKLVINGGVVDLASGVNETVKQLVLGTTTVPAGTYGSSDSGAANIDDVHFSGAGMVTVTFPTPFDYYAMVVPDTTQRGKANDPDHDGLTNFQEFLFGLSPILANGSLVTTTTSPSGITLSWSQRADATYVLQESVDLVTWTTSAITPTTAADQSHVYSADYVMKQAVLPYASGKKFVRVQATSN